MISSQSPTQVNCDPQHQQNVHLDQSCQIIQSRCTIRPTAGIILGSGLGGLADEIEHPTAIDYADLPILPKVSAHGHAGRLILGYLGGLPIVALQGRSHLYEGHDPDVTVASVRLMAKLGATICIASNAAGGVNPRFAQGDLVAIDSHINLFMRQPTFQMDAWSPSRAAADASTSEVLASGSITRVPSTPYDLALIKACQRIAQRIGFELPRGCYLGTLGPTYETRAEYRAFRSMGADMVGMSTVLEILTAAQLGLQTLAFSVITNVATPDVPTKTTHDEVLDVAKVAQRRMLPMIKQFFSELAGPPD